jgi:hypothetical protein
MILERAWKHAGVSGSAPQPLQVVGDAHSSSADYAAAIYGSLLAASTVLGTAAAGSTDGGSAALLAALVVTSVIFWLLHVYVIVVGRELPQHGSWLRATRTAARHEAPILLAVMPPAAAVVISMVLGEPGGHVGWSALLAAICGQVFWTWLAVRQAHPGRGVQLLSLGVSLLLGGVLIVAKLAIGH